MTTTLDYVRTNHQLNEHTVIPKRFQKKIEQNFDGNAEFITHQNIGDTSMRNFLYNLENQYSGHALYTTGSPTNQCSPRISCVNISRRIFSV